MIMTGSPAASLLATCGSDPTGLTSPFGGRHGTRLKILAAVVATSFTLSIALRVRLFGCAGFAWSTAATLPAPGATMAGDAGAFASSDRALSGGGVCWAAWAVCAPAGTADAGVSSTSAASASAASEAVFQRGRGQLIKNA